MQVLLSNWTRGIGGVQREDRVQTGGIGRSCAGARESNGVNGEEQADVGVACRQNDREKHLPEGEYEEDDARRDRRKAGIDMNVRGKAGDRRQRREIIQEHATEILYYLARLRDL